jgi:hypothetical protein
VRSRGHSQTATAVAAATTVEAASAWLAGSVLAYPFMDVAASMAASPPPLRSTTVGGASRTVSRSASTKLDEEGEVGPVPTGFAARGPDVWLVADGGAGCRGVDAGALLMGIGALQKRAVPPPPSASWH